MCAKTYSLSLELKQVPNLFFCALGWKSPSAPTAQSEDFIKGCSKVGAE
jgi:hypothetical protein